MRAFFRHHFAIITSQQIIYRTSWGETRVACRLHAFEDVPDDAARERCTACGFNRGKVGEM